MTLRIAVVAGEVSGDLLGGALLKALKLQIPDCQFEGIAGPQMQAQGCKSLYPLERLSVMGILAILQRLPELLVARKRLITHWKNNKPDLFIGIDAPEFNIGLELQLRSAGILTAHFVSPSVWAWRPKRIFKIKRAVDLMLALFPFELPIYRQHGVAVVHVGHPLADQIPLEIDQASARKALGLSESVRVLAVLPGSRGSELQHLSPAFIGAMQLLSVRDPALQFVLPCANQRRRAQFEQALQQHGTCQNLRLIDGQSHAAMAAADAVLLASGTATLEAMLFKKPMVVAYKIGVFSAWLFRRMLQVKSVSLPNLLVQRELVPELIQEAVTAENLADAVWQQMHLSPADKASLQQDFIRLHQTLRCNAAQRSADAIVALLRERKVLV